MTTPGDQGIASSEADSAQQDDLPIDHVLADLVQLINAIGSVEIGVTLHASGTIVSGALISGRRYFDLVIERFRESNSEFGQVFSEWFKPVADVYREDESSRKEDDQPAPRPVEFIHLRDAKTFGAGDSAPLPGVLWRGRLSEISGWSIGNFGELAPPPDFD